ncbi:MAG: hypothetical protein WC824_11970 [Bacteroidota bacterium]|jgi:hypothetical protein
MPDSLTSEISEEGTCLFCHRTLKGRFKLVAVDFWVANLASVRVAVHRKCLPKEIQQEIPAVLERLRKNEEHRIELAKRYNLDEWI